MLLLPTAAGAGVWRRPGAGPPSWWQGPIHNSTVHYGTVQYSTVQYSTGGGDGAEDGPGGEKHGAGGEDQRQVVGHLSSEAVNVNKIWLHVWYLASTRALFKCKRLKLNMFPRPV